MLWVLFHLSEISCGDSTFTFPKFHVVIPLVWNFMWWSHFHSGGDSTFTLLKFHVGIPLFWNLMCWCHFQFYKTSCADFTFTILKFHLVIQRSPFWNFLWCGNFTFTFSIMKIPCSEIYFYFLLGILWKIALSPYWTFHVVAHSPFWIFYVILVHLWKENLVIRELM